MDRRTWLVSRYEFGRKQSCSYTYCPVIRRAGWGQTARLRVPLYHCTTTGGLSFLFFLLRRYDVQKRRPAQNLMEEKWALSQSGLSAWRSLKPVGRAPWCVTCAHDAPTLLSRLGRRPSYFRVHVLPQDWEHAHNLRHGRTATTNPHINSERL
jgi:hypothetical protein